MFGSLFQADDVLELLVYVLDHWSALQRISRYNGRLREWLGYHQEESAISYAEI